MGNQGDRFKGIFRFEEWLEENGPKRKRKRLVEISLVSVGLITVLVGAALWWFSH